MLRILGLPTFKPRLDLVRVITEGTEIRALGRKHVLVPRLFALFLDLSESLDHRIFQ